MKVMRPADGHRLELLLYRLKALRQCDVKIRPDQIEALKRVVDILVVS